MLLVIEVGAGQPGLTYRNLTRAQLLAEALSYGDRIAALVTDALDWHARAATAATTTATTARTPASRLRVAAAAAAAAVDDGARPGTPLAARRDAIARSASQAAASPLAAPAAAALRSALGALSDAGSAAAAAEQQRGGRRSGAVTSSLQSRDLRVIDGCFDLARQPAILVRRHALVCNLPPTIRVVILPDRAWLLPQEGADAELAPILERLAAGRRGAAAASGGARGAVGAATAPALGASPSGIAPADGRSSRPRRDSGDSEGEQQGCARPGAARASLVAALPRALAPAAARAAGLPAEAAPPAASGGSWWRAAWASLPLKPMLHRDATAATAARSPAAPILRPLLGSGSSSGGGSSSSSSSSSSRTVVTFGCAPQPESSTESSAARGTQLALPWGARDPEGAAGGSSLHTPAPPPLAPVGAGAQRHSAAGLEGVVAGRGGTGTTPARGSAGNHSSGSSGSSSSHDADDADVADVADDADDALRAAEAEPADDGLPFELWVLETALLGTVAHLRVQLRGLDAMASRTVELLTRQRGSQLHLFDALRRAKQALGEYAGRVTAIHRVLGAVLDEPEDLRGMALTALFDIERRAALGVAAEIVADCGLGGAPPPPPPPPPLPPWVAAAAGAPSPPPVVAVGAQAAGGSALAAHPDGVRARRPSAAAARATTPGGVHHPHHHTAAAPGLRHAALQAAPGRSPATAAAGWWQRPERLRARSARSRSARGTSPPGAPLARGPAAHAASPRPPWWPALPSGGGGGCSDDDGDAAGSPRGADGAGGGSELDAVEGATEVLLEAYLAETEQLLQRATRLREALDDCEGQVNLQLATGRNRLMRVEVGLSTLTLSLTLCTVVSSYLGMNVVSGLETRSGAFANVVLGSGAAALLLACAIALALRRTLVV
jgi:hypothetical protein